MGFREIRFYSNIRDYIEFSNTYMVQISIDGKLYPSVEHYFQASKFITEAGRRNVMSAPTGKIAATNGKSRKYPIREDWNRVREEVMMTGLRAKFTQHVELNRLLLSTDGATLIEASPYDSYWGIGRYNTGRNRLGVLLMQLRDELKEEANR